MVTYSFSMKKAIIAALFLLSGALSAQYDIKINLKGNIDSTVYLVVHMWESNNIVDSCKKVKNGQIRFKGDKKLQKGLYILVNQERNTSLFEFFVADNQKFSLTADRADVTNSIKCPGIKENELFFEYNKFFADKNKEFEGYAKESVKMKKEDSTKFIKEKITKLNDDVKNFEPGFKQRMKGTFLEGYFALKTEKQATDLPKASNGRPDSVYAYYYWKTHFWDDIDLLNDGAIHTPLLDDRIKKYFDQVIFQHPDTVIKEIDNVLSKCKEGSTTYKMLLGHFTYKYESNKTMSFDKKGNSVTYEKVFIHMADKYITSGHAEGVYTAETIKAIKSKSDNNRHILPGAVAPEIYVLDTTNAKQVLKMKFDTCKTSASITKLYQKYANDLAPLWTTLHQVKAKYTVLVFWASDCGHCQTDIPKLSDTLKTIKGKIDFKVFAVQTKDDYEAFRKFVVQHKLDFINVYDPVHINDYRAKFDVDSTPVVYLLDSEKTIKAKKVGTKQVVELLELFDKIEKDQKK